MADAAESARAALAALDRGLAAGPQEASADFAEATAQLCLLRNELIAAGPAQAALLPQVNGLISSTLSGHFPLGAVPRPLLVAARASLQSILSRVAG